MKVLLHSFGKSSQVTVNPSSALGPHTEVQVHPLGVVVSGSATSLLLVIETSSSWFEEKGQPVQIILNWLLF